MIPFDQKTDMYRPSNRVKNIQEVDIIRTLDNFTVQDVVEKIQKVVKQKSLRINEFMKDYDPLRSGSITKYQFLSSLSMLKLYLSRKEAELLCDKYANPEKEGEVLWTKFADDIDIVFVIDVVIAVLMGISRDSSSSKNSLNKSSNVFSTKGSFNFFILMVYSDASPFSPSFLTVPTFLVIKS